MFTRLEAANFKLSVSKTCLALPKVLVLRHSVSALGISPRPHRVEAMTLMKLPSSTEEVRRFLRAVNFYMQFIPGCLGIANPLL